jgi:hypothetical protein
VLLKSLQGSVLRGSLQIGDPLAELMLRRASFVVDGEREVDSGRVLLYSCVNSELLN